MTNENQNELDDYLDLPERNGHEVAPRRVSSDIEREAAESHRHCETGKFDAVSVRALYQDARRELEQEGARMLEESVKWRRKQIEDIQADRAGIRQLDPDPRTTPWQMPPI